MLCKAFFTGLLQKQKNLGLYVLSFSPSSFQGIGNDIYNTKDVAHAKDDPDDDHYEVDPSPEVRLDQFRLLTI